MTVLDRITKAFSAIFGRNTKATDYDWPTQGPSQAFLTTLDGQPQWKLSTLQAFIDEGYEGNAIINAAISYIYDSAKLAPLRVYEGTRDDPQLAPIDSDIAKLIDRPNPHQSWAEFQSLNIVYYNLSGNCYIYLVRNSDDVIEAMYTLRPDKVRIILDKKDNAPVGYELKGYVYSPTDNAKDFLLPILPQDMMHIKMPNPDDVTSGLAPGVGRILPSAHSADVDNSFTRFLKLFFDRGAMPPVMLSFDVQVSQEIAQRAEERFVEIYGNYREWIKPFVAGPSLKMERVGLTLDELAADKIDARSEVRILSALGVPPILVGAKIGLDRATYSNYAQARQAFWEDRLLAQLEDFESEYRYFLRDGDLFVMFDISNVPAFAEIRQQRTSDLLDAWREGLVTRAEYRKHLGLPTTVGDEVYKTSLNTVLTPAINREPENEEGAASAIDEPNEPNSKDVCCEQAGEAKTKIVWPTAEAKLNYWKQVDDIATEWESRFADVAAEQFSQQHRKIMSIISSAQKSAYQQKQTVDWASVSSEVEGYILSAAKDNWRSAFIPVLRGLIEEQAAASAIALGVTFDVQNLFAGAWFDDYVGTFSTEISNTSWDEMARIFRAAQDEGWSIPRVSENLDVLFNQWIYGNQVGYMEGLTDEQRQRLIFATERLPPYRLELIARDQTLRASNAGNHNLYVNWGVETRQWLATPDERVRPEHLNADGQIRAIDEPFEVGGQQMMFPGDGSLGASLNMIIQCRCTTIPVIEGFNTDIARPAT